MAAPAAIFIGKESDLARKAVVSFHEIGIPLAIFSPDEISSIDSADISESVFILNLDDFPEDSLRPIEAIRSCFGCVPGIIAIGTGGSPTKEFDAGADLHLDPRNADELLPSAFMVLRDALLKQGKGDP
ncbi:hypothetical protein [Paramagnetospirillum magneticum]|uniref:Uncharacterized protein n=1 Tax=Paramagnetospirillum magneticum (strain ATCC 700264 / AMB-1) TaxID=342108 RepID=Q2W877_PARM1|nr:hypothetical protein [Paramagnetospirillum magneticum]BAE49948.1 hypothetical protein amb1144 [Paramagnetospirillum magneticum AMB-1]